MKLMSRFARMLALVVFVLSLFSGSVKVSKAITFAEFFAAQSSAEKNVDETINAVINSDLEGIPSHESFVDDNTLNLQTSLFLTIAGPPEGSDSSISKYTEEERRILSERYGGGVINGIASATAALFNPPVSSTIYLADLMESAHIIPEAQAQGLGFSSLDPVLVTWKVFRNIAYMFFVVMFLIIGFMIMFRQKIGGQTVVTAQQAIPGIIVSLIFVTFSYAIAGFLIDLMYLLMYLMINVFSPARGTDILDQNFIEFGIRLVTGNESVFSTVNASVNIFVDEALGGDNAIGALAGFVGGITMALIVSIAILIGVFKIFFELLKSYITIIIAVATAPLTLMMGAIPGKNNFAQWIKMVAGNLMAFPTVLFALILYEMFTVNNNLEAGGFVPPYLIGRGTSGAIIALVGIGILLIIPELIKEVKKAFGADGGIWEQLAGAAVKNAGEGAGVGARISGAGTGATLGVIGGAGVAAWRNRSDLFKGKFVDFGTAVGSGALTGGRRGMAGGTTIGGKLATSAGAQSSGIMSSIGNVAETGGTYFGDRSILDRAENKDLHKGEDFGKQVKAAKDRAEVKRRQAEEGLIVQKSSDDER